jgi:uncharacterized damage-inducible protein DinB
MNLAAHYLEEVLRQLRGHKRLADGALQQVTDEEFFRELDSESNNLAIIVKHIAGNLRSRFSDFLTSDGEKVDRNRDQEFELTTNATREDLLRAWEQGWKIVLDSVSALKPEDVERTVTIRSEPHTVLQAINRAVAHMAYHAGQIVYIAKLYKSGDWQTLSVPRGKTDEFNAKMCEKHGGAKA